MDIDLLDHLIDTERLVQPWIDMTAREYALLGRSAPDLHFAVDLTCNANIAACSYL